MKRFGYLKDGLFLVSVAGYALNRWVLKPRLTSPFLHGQFNDLLLIPAALPVLLWIQRMTHLRGTDAPPSWQECLMHLAIWSVVCESVGPFWLHLGTADAWDVVAYAAGGTAAFLWWNRPERSRTTPFAK